MRQAGIAIGPLVRGARMLLRARGTWTAVGIAGTLALATAALHAAGGTHTVFPHLFYFPVVWAAVLWGPPGGVAVGVVAGILAGPLTPLDADAGTSQALSSWLIRLAFFSAVGGVTGGFSLALAQRINDVKRLNDQTVRALVQAVDARDPYTAQHSEKVAACAADIASLLGLGPRARARMRWAALLHDLGKLALPESILNKSGPLDAGEWELVKRHPAESVRIIKGVDGYRSYLPAIRHHHERFDGEGYPDGLRGESIPLDARVLAVADAFDAMTSDRSYRAGLTEEEALRRLVAGAGSQFDPQIALAFARSRGQTELVIEAPAASSLGGSLEHAPLAGRRRLRSARPAPSPAPPRAPRARRG